jgi:hypothetical protein
LQLLLPLLQLAPQVKVLIEDKDEVVTEQFDLSDEATDETGEVLLVWTTLEEGDPA